LPLPANGDPDIADDVSGGSDQGDGPDPAGAGVAVAPPLPLPRTSFMSNLVAQNRECEDAKLMRDYLKVSLEPYSYISVPVKDDDGRTVSLGASQLAF
jgi:hypothetical protein